MDGEERKERDGEERKEWDKEKRRKGLGRRNAGKEHSHSKC